MNCVVRASILLIVLILHVSSFPVQFNGPSSLATKFPNSDAFSFMKRFGYLEGNEDSEALYRQDAVRDAIKNVQKFGAIPQTGVIDNATLELMKKSRCGVPDLVKNSRTKRFVLGPSKWKKRHITYYLASWTPKLGEETVVRNIQKALDTWGQHARLTFSRTFDSDADIIVDFKTGPHGDNFPFDGSGNILAHAYFPGSGLGGDIHFDDDEEWTIYTEEAQDGTDFFSVAVHELGHSLGLAHSWVEESVMFPYFKGYEPEFKLAYDDILGMYEHYIKGFPEMEASYEPPKPEITTRRYEVSTKEYQEEHEKQNPTSSSSIPDICEGNFDAIATLRSELFIFKNRYIWRLKERQQIERGYPVTINQMFADFPNEIEKIDAAYERPDGMIVLFIGQNYWIYNGERFIDNGPQPISNYGLPDYVDKVDAVQTWGKNGKTYLFKNDRFWRYDEVTKSVDPGYPRSMDVWKGVPQDLDAATTWRDGITYFFKGKQFWKFDNNWVSVVEAAPLPTPQVWLGCPEKEDMREYYYNQK